ncbi:hypothetical protein JCM14076_24720 [Methylosoma difficile]
MSITKLTIISFTAFFNLSANADIKSDRQNIGTACRQDAQTANCGTEQVGTGLLKCLHEYKQSNRAFKFSDDCEAARLALKTDKKNTNNPSK